jgi:hypothetical protein
MKHIKQIFTLFTLSFLFLSVSGCGSSQGDKPVTFEENPPFVISDIYSQAWIAGIQGGGAGTNVHITLESIEEGVTLDKIYFRRKSELLTQMIGSPTTFTGYFKSEKNRDVIMHDNPVKEANNTPPDPFPFQLGENEAVIAYTVNKSSKFFKVSNIVEKEIIAYPATNPNGLD